MNNRFLLVAAVFFQCYPVLSEDILEESIKQGLLDTIRPLCINCVKIDASQKRKYLLLNQEIVEQAQKELHASHFDRADYIRLGLGAVSLGSAAFSLWLLYAEGINFFSNAYHADSVNTKTDSESFLAVLLCGIWPITVAPVATYVGFAELYKGFTKYDRRQAFIKAHATAALLARVRSLHAK